MATAVKVEEDEVEPFDIAVISETLLPVASATRKRDLRRRLFGEALLFSK